jgi:hypothetical protein
MRVSEGASRSRWADEEGRRRGPGGCGRSDGWRRESLSESEDVVRGHAQWSRWGSFTFQAGMRRSRCVCERERERALGWRLLRGQIAQRCSNYEFTAAACSADWSARRARADMTRPSPASHIGSTFLLARQHLRSFF